MQTVVQTGLTREAVEALAQVRHDPEWLARLRLAAWDAFERMPLPTTRTEGWRRTSLALILRTNPVKSGASSSTSIIWTPWTSMSEITTISRAPAAA